jgi:ribosome-associated toxin RatA of RatAB toxin-antitoxin module
MAGLARESAALRSYLKAGGRPRSRGFLSGAFSFVPPPPVRSFARTEVVGWSPEALFAVVSDVGRYSEFVPLCTQSRVIKSHGPDLFDATLGLGYMGISEEYTSRVKLVQPQSVVADAVDARLFKRMRTVWSFAPADNSGGGRDRGTSSVGQLGAAIPPGAAGQIGEVNPPADAVSFAVGSCKLSLSIEMQLRAHSHDQLLRAVMDKFARQQVEAFKRRCLELYGEGLPSGGAHSSRSGGGGAGRGAGDMRARAAGSGGGGGDGGEAVATRSGSSTPPSVEGSARDAGAAPQRSSPPRAAGASGWQQARARPGGSALTQVQMDPRWRADVERAFEAHALDGSLSLGRFVEACRALGCANGALASLPLASSGALKLVVQPASAAGRVVQAATSVAALEDVGVASADELVDSRSLLTAVLFVEFDADGNGIITRDEFVSHLWMLTHASEEQKQSFAFDKLDLNRSGRLERGDLVQSMQRQLSLAKAVSPLIVQQQLRRHSIASEQRKSISATAVTAACEAIDAMQSQVRALPQHSRPCKAFSAAPLPLGAPS